MEKSIGFIGGGRITRIILKALSNRNRSLAPISVAETDGNIADRLKTQFPDISIVDAENAASKEIVFIALHPPVIMEMIDKIKGSVPNNAIIISLAPKITIKKIASGFEMTNRIVRLIPNATSYINEGFNPITFSPEISTEEKESLLELLEVLGKTFEVDESKLEAYAIVSAMAPTYFWFQWDTLSAVGERIGLDKEEASNTVYQTLKAALKLQFEAGLTFEEVTDLIPVKPICDYETDINRIFNEKLVGLHQKIKP